MSSIKLNSCHKRLYQIPRWNNTVEVNHNEDRPDLAVSSNLLSNSVQIYKYSTHNEHGGGCWIRWFTQDMRNSITKAQYIQNPQNMTTGIHKALKHWPINTQCYRYRYSILVWACKSYIRFVHTTEYQLTQLELSADKFILSYPRISIFGVMVQSFIRLIELQITKPIIMIWQQFRVNTGIQL